jgi:hypothetical protein
VDCRGTGKLLLTECPQKRVGEDEIDAIRAAELAKQGSWPILAGWLDQAASLVEAVRWIWIQDEYWRMKG